MSTTSTGTAPTASVPYQFTPRIRFNNTRGLEIENVERIPSVNALARVQALAAAGYEVESTPEDSTPFSLISYFLPSGGSDAGVTAPLATTWGLAGNEIEKDLWSHPKIVAETVKFSALGFTVGNELLKRVRTLINSFVEGQTVVQAVLLNIDPEALDDGETEAITYDKIGLYLGQISTARGLGLDAAPWAAFIQSRLRGVEAWPVSTYSLVRQQTWAGNAVNRVVTANVNKVYTTQQLINIEGLENVELVFQLADGFWLKKTPTVQQQDDGRYVATNEWYWAESYDSFLYERV